MYRSKGIELPYSCTCHKQSSVLLLLFVSSCVWFMSLLHLCVGFVIVIIGCALVVVVAVAVVA